MFRILCFFVVSLSFLSTTVAVAQLRVLSRTPLSNAKNVAPLGPVSIQFDRPINGANLQDNILITGSFSGRITGSFSTEQNNTITFRPSPPFLIGEKVTITVTTRVTGSDGSRISRPESWSFNVRPPVGSLNFSTRFTYGLRTGSEPSNLATVDLNGDSMPDVVVINSNNGVVSIFENQFRTNNRLALAREIIIPSAVSKSYPVTSALPESVLQDVPTQSNVLSADLNNNGSPDMVILSPRDNRFIVLRNNQNSIPSLSTEFFSTGERPISLTSGDFNGDGFIDLAISSLGNDRVYVHLNNGSGSFLSPQTYSVGKTPASIQAADMDGDQFTDIVVLSTGDRRIDVLKNNGTGQFSSSTYLSQLNFIPSLMIVESVVSTNGNLLPDVILGVSDQRFVNVYANSGSALTSVGQISMSNASRPMFAHLSDLDSDGTFDLITTHLISNNLYVNRMQPNGSSSNLTNVDPDGILQPSGIASADISGSGSLDILVPSIGSSQLNLYLNVAEGGSCDQIIGGLTIPDLIDFGDVTRGSLNTRDFSINNRSNALFDFVLELQDNTFFLLTSDRQYELVAGAIRSNTVTFRANDVGEYRTQIVVTFNSVCGVGQKNIELRARILPAKPDLEATQFAPLSTPSEYLLGKTYTFQGVFKSNGDAALNSPFNISFLIDNQVDQNRRFTNSVQPGQSFAQQFSYVFTKPGLTTLTYFVDSTEEIDESIENNNKISITISVKEGKFKVSPNPFTPNSDGYNDQVNFDFSELFNITNPSVQILNLEGQLIRNFGIQDSVNGVITWDGRDKSGRIMRPGVFLYAVFNDGKLLSRGSITLAL